MTYRQQYSRNIVGWDNPAWQGYEHIREQVRQQYEQLTMHQRDASAVTPLSGFEIWMLCNGYMATRICALMSIHPTFRTYRKDGMPEIHIHYGLRLGGRSVNFYITTDNRISFRIGNRQIGDAAWQLPTDPADYERAVNLQLPNLYEEWAKQELGAD